MDIRSPKLEETMQNIDVVFHIAGIISLPACNDNPFEAYSVNVAGTANVLEAARRNGVKKVIFASTSALYENATTTPFQESILLNPTLVYAQTKKAAEDLCRSFIKMFGMDITILRFFNVYGPHMDYRPPSYLISYIIGSLLRKKRPVLHSNGKQARDFVYVTDVTKLCEIIMTNKASKNELFNVGSGQTITIQGVFDILAKIMGEKKIKPIYRNPKLIWEKFPRQLQGKYSIDPELLKKEVNKYTLSDTQKTKQLLNWKAKVAIEEGLTQTVIYAKERPNNMHLL